MFGLLLKGPLQKEEWVVQIFVDRQRLRGRIGCMQRTCWTPDHSLPEMAFQLSDRSGQRLEELVRQEIDERVTELFAQLILQAEASTTAVRVCITDPEVRKKAVFHAAFLVSREKRSAFQQKLDTFGTEWAPIGFTICLLGPFSPYSFDPMHG